MHEKMLISRKITGADPELTCYDNVQELYLPTDDDGEGTILYVGTACYISWACRLHRV